MKIGFPNIIMDYAYEKSKAKPIRKKKELIFVLPKIIGIVGWVSFIPGLLILIYGLIDFNIVNIGTQIGLFGGLGLILICLRRVMRIVISNKGITKTSMIGTKKYIDWREVRSVKYKKVAQELVIKSHAKKVRCNLYLVGFNDLVEIIEKKTKITKTDMKIPTEIITQHHNVYNS